MKAARYYGIEDIRFEELEKPSCLDDEVRIKVTYAGICGSDLHIYKKGMFIQNIPETMGHEFIGIIETVGKNVTKYKKGDAVTANPMVPCMECESCKKGRFNTCEALGFIGEVRQGCYAQYLTMEQKKLIPIPVEVSNPIEDLKKYVLTEPLAVAVNVLRRADFKREDKLAVLGAGPIGCLVIALAKQIYGVGSVTAVDLSAERLRFAAQAGADCCLADGETLSHDYTSMVDCAGVSKTIALAQEHIAADGKLCIVSIFENAAAVDCNRIVEKQLRVIGCNVYAKEDLDTAVSLLMREEFQIEFLITHVFSLAQCREAFALLTNGEKTAQKVVFLTEASQRGG